MKLLHYNSTFYFTMLSFYRTTNLDLSIFTVLRNSRVFSGEFSPDFGHWECINSRDGYVIFMAENRGQQSFFSICYLMTLLQALSSESWWCSGRSLSVLHTPVCIALMVWVSHKLMLVWQWRFPCWTYVPNQCSHSNHGDWPLLRGKTRGA